MESAVRQRGSVSILPVIIAATLGVGLAASVYLNYVQHQRAADAQRQLNGTIVDLRYQLGLDAAGNPTSTPGASASPSASPSPSGSPSPSPAAVLGSASLSIPELGIKLTATAPLADLTYSIIAASTPGAVVAALTSPSFVAKYPTCKPGTALGQLVRRATNTVVPSGNVLVGSVGAYNYYYYRPGNTCATTTAGKADTAVAQAALLDTIFKTLSQ